MFEEYKKARRDKAIEQAAQRVVPDAFQDPALDAVRPLVRAGNLDAGRQLLAACRELPELRSGRVKRLGGDAIPHRDVLTGMSKAHPDDPDIALWLGVTRIEHAWQVRTGARGKDVSREQFNQFWFLLGGTHEPLSRAAELLDADPAPWAHLQWRGLGLQVDRAELDDLWTQVLKRDPDNFYAHHTRLQALCAKWQGSNDEVLEFAAHAGLAAPDGAPQAGLVVLAHLEVAANTNAGPGYFRQTRIREQVTASADRWFAVPHSGPWTEEVQHLFGAAFTLIGDTERARRHLAECRPDRMPYPRPWHMIGGPKRYLRARLGAGLKL